MNAERSTRPGVSLEDLRPRLLTELAQGPVVLTAPTGTGKSTEVPRWCPGPVCVIEPRRVACRTLAQRVADLERTELGSQVGYVVRNETRAGPDTRITFMTPGVALRRLAELDHYQTVIIDEFHERRQDTDLLLALQRARAGRLLVMSATMDGDRVARYLDGRHLRAETRAFPVDIEYLPRDNLLPDPDGLVPRVHSALDRCTKLDGDVLVFLPGKAEIRAVAKALHGNTSAVVRELHGGLRLQHQLLAFEPAEESKKRIILATNVAETSLTVPGIRVVVDSGLVRRTRYHQGRGYLTLVPIALDSAAQRAGRAGRTQPGICLRLWDRRAKLASETPAEVHRESLTPMVLAAANAGHRLSALELLDAPHDHAIETAEQELGALEALDENAALTATGRQLFALPVDPFLARLLVEVKKIGDAALTHDVIDWVSGLGVGRPLFFGAAEKRLEYFPRDVDAHCDASQLVAALRGRLAKGAPLDEQALGEARALRKRLLNESDLPKHDQLGGLSDRNALLLCALRADPRVAYVARQHKRRVAFSNGGTEIELSRDSGANLERQLEAIVVGASRAVGMDLTKTRIFATSASAVSHALLLAAGLGRERVGRVDLEHGKVLAVVERVYARRVIGRSKQTPTGPLAREALVQLVLEGRLFPDAAATSRRRLDDWALLGKVQSSSQGKRLGITGYEIPEPDLGRWLLLRLEKLGVESGDDLELLSEVDLSAPKLPAEIEGPLRNEFPRTVDLGDARYQVEYRLDERLVYLRQVAGSRTKPPPRSFLPSFAGFRIFAEAGGTVHRIR